MPVANRLDCRIVQHRNRADDFRVGDVAFFVDHDLDADVAVDPGGKLYGGERVRQFLERAATTNATAGSLVAALRAEVDAFGAGVEVADDLTVLVLRWNGARK